MALFASLGFGIIPMFLFAWGVYSLDRYEKEPKRLLGAAFAWGAIVAAAGSFLINSIVGASVFILTGSESAMELTTGSLVAPMVEEIFKGLAVLLVFLFYRSEFDSILDGMIYAAVAALGFAATENAFYIYNHGFLEDGWDGLYTLAFIRIVLVGWQHPFYSAFTGIGLALSRLNRSNFLKIFLPIAGLGAAIFSHSLHNSIAIMFTGIGGLALGTFIDWSGWLIMFLFALGMVYRENRYLRRHLAEEIELGVITDQQYKTACSPVSQAKVRMQALRKRLYRQTDRFYQLCGEIAHKKHQYEMLGDEGINLLMIGRLRKELRTLPQAVM